ncbi:MAG: electron transfer flavoprotein subunit beta/FixA family protein [Anaeromyxobacteraceae bacterium]
MKILVCVKQVPDMSSRFAPDGAGTWFSDTDLAHRINEYDECAIEQAIQLKEQLGGAPEVTALSIGPARVGEALRKALAMGCDRALHVDEPQPSRLDPWQVASIVTAHARAVGYDLVLTGMQSQDRGSGQVGVLVAEQLGIQSVTTAVSFEYADGAVTVRRELEGGARARVRVRLPAVVTCQLGLNVARYPTLPNIMKAKKKPLEVVAAAALLAAEPLGSTARFFAPSRRIGQVLEGPVDQLVDRLVTLLGEKAGAKRQERT